MNICYLLQTDGSMDFNVVSEIRNQGLDVITLNWQSHDESCDLCISGLSWSKGREALYFEAQKRKEYDYFIFADDDLDFNPSTELFFKILLEKIEKHKPDLFQIKGGNWQDKNTLNIFEDHYAYQYDLQIQVMSNKLASLVFPCIYDGGHGTLWTAAHECKLNNLKNITTNIISVNNKNHNITGEYGGTNKSSESIWLELNKSKLLLTYFLDYRKIIKVINVINSLRKC